MPTPKLNFKQVCDDAGLGVMEQVLEIVHDREEVPDETLASLTAEDVFALYEMFVGPAVDRVTDYLGAKAPSLG